jgi:hypothetical protein
LKPTRSRKRRPSRARVSYDLEAALGDAALQLKPNM